MGLPVRKDSTGIEKRFNQKRENWMRLYGFDDIDQEEAEALNRMLLKNGIAAGIVVNREEVSLLIHGRDVGILVRRLMQGLGYGLQDIVIVHPSQVDLAPQRAYASCMFIKGGEDKDPRDIARMFDPMWLMSVNTLFGGNELESV